MISYLYKRIIYTRLLSASANTHETVYERTTNATATRPKLREVRLVPKSVLQRDETFRFYIVNNNVHAETSENASRRIGKSMSIFNFFELVKNREERTTKLTFRRIVPAFKYFISFRITLFAASNNCRCRRESLKKKKIFFAPLVL